MSEIRIREANLADVATIAPLFDAYRQFYEQAPDLAAASAFIAARLQNRESVILLAFGAGRDANAPVNGAGEAIGFCQMYPTFCSVLARPVVVLYDLFVAPAARQSGAGRALLLAAEDHARGNGFARMDLTTARDNHRAQALYRSAGWIKDGVFDAYNKAL